VPTIQSAMMTARKSKTIAILKELGMALEDYEKDFGDYPPSRPWRTNYAADEPKPIGAMQTGAANLVFYLRGPAGSGWGIEAGGRMPYDTGASTTGPRPNRGYGPYYQAAADAMTYERDPVGGQDVPGAFLDGYKPAGRILYFRYERIPRIKPGSSPAASEPNYDVRHNDPLTPAIPNPSPGGGDQCAKVNYGDQAKFEEIVRLPTYYTGITRWVRQDFILISPGPDGRYGWIIKQEDGSILAASRNDQGSPTYDDVTNWQ